MSIRLRGAPGVSRSYDGSLVRVRRRLGRRSTPDPDRNRGPPDPDGGRVPPTAATRYLFTPAPLPGAVPNEDDGSVTPDPAADPNPADGEAVDVPEVDTPEVDTPEVDVPSVRNPADDLPDEASIDSDVSGPFAVAVVYANVALFGVSLGAMLIGFEGRWRWGGAAVLVGVFAAVRVYQTYRSFERDRAAAEAEEENVG